tara:strand:- start:33913 stop:34308 length:396 start_codon:yes stop_codon:yes gene_type:complete
MMKELLEDLQDSPPQNEEELREILAETGYDLIMTEPSGEDDDQEDEKAGEESMEMMGDEEMDDMEEEEEDEKKMAKDKDPDDADMEMDIMKEMMPMSSMMGPPKAMTPRMVMAIRTKKAAKKALDPKRGKK